MAQQLGVLADLLGLSSVPSTHSGLFTPSSQSHQKGRHLHKYRHANLDLKILYFEKNGICEGFFKLAILLLQYGGSVSPCYIWL